MIILKVESLEGVETFNSNSKPIRIPFPLWVGFSKTSGLQQLQGLVQRVEQRLSCLGFPFECREFVPHLTIARVKALSRNHPFLPGKDPSVQKMRIGTWVVSAIVLFESELLPSGSLYRTLGEWPLEGLSMDQNAAH